MTDWRRGVKEREATRSDDEDSRGREGSWQDGRAVNTHREAGTGCWDGKGGAESSAGRGGLRPPREPGVRGSEAGV